MKLEQHTRRRRRRARCPGVCRKCARALTEVAREAPIKARHLPKHTGTAGSGRARQDRRRTRPSRRSRMPRRSGADPVVVGGRACRARSCHRGSSRGWTQAQTRLVDVADVELEQVRDLPPTAPGASREFARQVDSPAQHLDERRWFCPASKNPLQAVDRIARFSGIDIQDRSQSPPAPAVSPATVLEPGRAESSSCARTVALRPRACWRRILTSIFFMRCAGLGVQASSAAAAACRRGVLEVQVQHKLKAYRSRRAGYHRRPP